jgi:hypothetical protein
MIADFLTTPLQGVPFLKYRNIIMNIKNEKMGIANDMLPQSRVLRDHRSAW